jgi:hypothetical protein
MRTNRSRGGAPLPTRRTVSCSRLLLTEETESPSPFQGEDWGKGLAMRLKASLSQLWLAGRLGVWLCMLPLRLRIHPLPTLLHHLALIQERGAATTSVELERAVRLVVRVCRLWCFRWPMFPRACLRQALALYHVLTRMGYPVAIHFGVHKEGEELRGHSWVTLQGKPVAERTRPEAFTPVYSYPATPSYSAHEADTG